MPLGGAIFYHVAAAEPEHPDYPHGQWYCMNPECVVRQVSVACKLYGDPLPAMDCPACHEPMKFEHWWREETLVPCPVG